MASSKTPKKRVKRRPAKLGKPVPFKVAWARVMRKYGKAFAELAEYDRTHGT